LYVRGHRGDYDEWARMGAEGWDWESVLPHFKKSENWLGEAEEKYHGVGGKMDVSPVAYMDPITKSFLDGGKEMGYEVGDINGDEQDSGFSISQTTTLNGKREGAFKAFAEPYIGRNLTILDHSHVTRLLLEDGLAVGVEVLRHGVSFTFRCTREVVVSAGAVGSPHLLMLSGIGDQKNLREVGVPVLQDLPGVGQNLQDHLLVQLNLDVGDGLALSPVLEPVSSLASYLLQGTGPLSHTGVDAMAQVRTNLSRDSRPDIQLILASLSLATDMGLMTKPNMGLSEKAWNYLEHGVGRDTASIMTILSRPKSRGTIRLRSPDPHVHPVIDPYYLSNEEDLQTLKAGLKIAKRLAETEAMKKAGAKEWSHRLDPYCGKEVYDSDEYWTCYVMHWSFTVYHPVGTCAMGSVTDNRLRVKGVRGLRVADASVMPNIIGGNTNAAVIMIGEKAAHMILEDWDDTVLEDDERTGEKADDMILQDWDDTFLENDDRISHNTGHKDTYLKDVSPSIEINREEL